MFVFYQLVSCFQHGGFVPRRWLATKACYPCMESTTQMASNKGLLPLYGKSFKMFCTQLAIGTMASFYYFDQNPFRFLVFFHIWILLSQRSLNNKSPNLHKIAKPWWILAVVLKWRHVFTSSRHGHFYVAFDSETGSMFCRLAFWEYFGRRILTQIPLQPRNSQIKRL